MSEALGNSENNFGKEWGEIRSPVVAVVGAIDDSEEDIKEYRVGLSAMQLDNLNILRLGKAYDKSTLVRAVLRNQEGLSDDQEYLGVIVSFEGKDHYAEVYNAFGKLSLRGEGIRISKKLAEDLKVALGSKVILDKPKDIIQVDDLMDQL